MVNQLLAAAENGSEWDLTEVEALVRRLVAHLDGGLPPTTDQGAVLGRPRRFSTSRWMGYVAG